MSLTKNSFILFFLGLPSLAIANDIDKVIFDIKQIIAESRKLDIENIEIVKPDNRVKLSRCEKNLSVKFPFKSNKTILVECEKPNWKFFTTFKSKKKSVYFKFTRNLKIGDLLTIEDIKKHEGYVNLNKFEKNLSFEKILGTRLIKDVDINEIIGRN